MKKIRRQPIIHIPCSTLLGQWIGMPGEEVDLITDAGLRSVVDRIDIYDRAWLALNTCSNCGGPLPAPAQIAVCLAGRDDPRTEGFRPDWIAVLVHDDGKFEHLSGNDAQYRAMQRRVREHTAAPNPSEMTELQIKSSFILRKSK